MVSSYKFIIDNGNGTITERYATTAEIEAIEQHEQQMAVSILEKRRAEALKIVNDSAEAYRQTFLTPGESQMLVYYRKGIEANRLLDMLTADPTYVPQAVDYPMLSKCVGYDGANLAAVATTIRSLDANWTLIAARVDRIRRELFHAVLAAETLPEINQLVSSIDYSAD